jgi:hypothetical protein
MKYICLQSINGNSKFYSNCNEEESKMRVGEIIKHSEKVQYRILGFADNDYEARRILYPTVQDEEIAIANYIHEMAQKLYSVEEE